jgi:uncharacterized protein (TIGR04141 family)
MARHDVTTDRLTAVVAETGDADLWRVRGGRSVNFVADITELNQIRDLSARLVDLRSLPDYQQSFAYIENIIEEDDEAVVDAVLADIWDRSAPGVDTVQVEIAWWEEIRDEDGDRVVTHFRLPLEIRDGSKPPEQRSRSLALTWRGVRAALERRFPNDSPAAKLKKALRFYNETDDEIDSCDIRELLVAETTLNGIHYILSEGNVFRVDAGYLHALDGFLENLVVGEQRLPLYTGGAEGAYNASTGLALLDQKLITVEGSKIELCDLIDADGRMIFVKRNTGKAAPMSHLWAQIVASCVLLHRSPAARDTALLRLDQIDGVPVALTRAIAAGARNLTVVLAVLGATDISQLTLLARIPLRAAVQRLQDLDYTVEIELVPGPGQHLPAHGDGG